MDTSLRFHSPPSFSAAGDLLLRIADTRAYCSPRAVDRPVALYGAGNLGRMAREYFDRLRIPLVFVIDAKDQKVMSDPFWEGIPVMHPGAIDPKTRKNVLLAICVVTSPYAELARSLSFEGWTDVVPFYDIAEAYRDRHPLSNGWFAAPFSSIDTNNIETVLEAWTDDISRAHHLQFIAWRRLREEWSFAGAPVTTGNRFFIPEVLAVLTDHESFADVGAHTGSVSQRFIETVSGHFREIWAVEPDSVNLSGLRLTFSRLPAAANRRVKIIPAVVGGERGEKRFFQGLGYASQCSDLGQSTLAVETIDDLGLSPSFIKLHLEGAELDALKGARNTIGLHRPIIAATTYHNREGLWELPQWLMGELSGYQFHMRLHSWCGTGSVVYCIPIERIRGETHALSKTLSAGIG